jgi:hypothetical protein
MQALLSIKARLASIVVMVGLLAGVLVGTGDAWAQTSGQSDLLGIIQQFVSAFNAGDTATLQNIVDPSFQSVVTNWPTNAPPEVRAPSNRDTQLQNASQHLIQTAASNCSVISPNTAQCDIMLSGAPIASLPHPWKETAVFTFSNGKIVRLDERLSDTTKNDFAQIFASQQPGMPTTGSANGNGTLFLAIMVSAALLAAGGVARRVSRVSRVSRASRASRTAQ